MNTNTITVDETNENAPIQFGVYKNTAVAATPAKAKKANTATVRLSADELAEMEELGFDTSGQYLSHKLRNQEPKTQTKNRMSEDEINLRLDNQRLAMQLERQAEIIKGIQDKENTGIGSLAGLVSKEVAEIRQREAHDKLIVDNAQLASDLKAKQTELDTLNIALAAKDKSLGMIEVVKEVGPYVKEALTLFGAGAANAAQYGGGIGGFGMAIDDYMNNKEGKVKMTPEEKESFDFAKYMMSNFSKPELTSIVSLIMDLIQNKPMIPLTIMMYKQALERGITDTKSYSTPPPTPPSDTIGTAEDEETEY
jgi:hypothetical protein